MGGNLQVPTTGYSCQRLLPFSAGNWQGVFFASLKKGDRDFSLSLNTLHGVPLVMVSKHFYFFTRFAIMSKLSPDLKQAKDNEKGISPVVHHFAAEQIL